MTDPEIVVAIMRLVASVGDPHTQVEEGTTGFHRYPVQLLWFPDGLHVVAATKEHRALLGARLLQIGETPVGRAIEKVVPVFPHQNLPWAQFIVPDFITNAEVLSAQGIVASDKAARFVFEDTSGRKASVLLQRLQKDSTSEWVSLPKKGLRRKHPDLYYWFEYLPDSKTLYFNYRRCEDMKDQPFVEFNRRLFSFIDSHKVERLIIDLRDNSGGNSGIIDPFVKEISKRDLLNDDGALFVVIDRGTYSAGVMAAYSITNKTEAILVGGPTSGKPNFYGEVKDFTLKHSHIGIQYSTNYFNQVKGDPPSLFPEIKATLSWADYVSGNDPAINAIRQYSGPD